MNEILYKMGLTKNENMITHNNNIKNHTLILLVANSTPMVDFDSRLNSLRVNLANRLLLPTPESPIRTTIIYK